MQDKGTSITFVPRMKNPPNKPGWYYSRKIGFYLVEPRFICYWKGKLMVAGQSTLDWYKDINEYDWFGAVPNVQEAILQGAA